MKPTLFPVLLISVVCAACLDFVEPEPEPPREPEDARVHITAFRVNDSTFEISGAMFPGFDESGARRGVLREDVIVFGVSIPPDTTIEGTPVYRHHMIADDSLRSIFTVDPPEITGIPSRPIVRWFGFRQVGADTVRLQRGEDLVLHIESNFGISQPTPDSRRWSVHFGANAPGFIISADGVPPDSLTVPAQYLPLSDSVMTVSLSYSQSSLVTMPKYSGTYHYITGASWTVVVR
jgi:hypothetical protein